MNLKECEDPKTNTLQLVKKSLEGDDCGDWLMIVDNADDMNVLFCSGQDEVDGTDVAPASNRCLFSYIPENSNGSIIYTTRSKANALQLTGVGTIIRIGALNPVDSEKLLESKLGGGIECKEGWTNLLEELEHLPLAIVQAASYIVEKSWTVSRYLQHYLQKDSDGVSDFLNHSFRDQAREQDATNAVLKTWIITFIQIRQQDARAAELLSLMTYFDRQKIPAYLLRDEAETSRSFDNSIGTLVAFSFVSATADSQSFTIHRLVQISTRYWLIANGQAHHWAEEALVSLSRRFPDDEYDNKDRCDELYPHVQTVLIHNRLPAVNLCARGKLLSNVSWHLISQGQYHLAERYAQQALEDYEVALGNEDARIFDSVYSLGKALRHQGKYEAAKMMSQRGLEGREKSLGRDHLDTLASLVELAAAMYYLGDYRAAEVMDRQALEGYEKILGMDHPHTLYCVNDLAAALSAQGEYEASEQMNRRAFEGRKQALGQDHFYTLLSAINMACDLILQGKYAKAEEINQQALERSEKSLGKDHPRTLQSLRTMGLLFERQEKYDAAEEMIRRVMTGYKKTLGEGHHETCQSVHLLARLLHRQKKYEAAEDMYRRAMAGMEKTLPKYHPQILQLVSDLAAMLEIQGKYDAAKEMIQRALEGYREQLHANT